MYQGKFDSQNKSSQRSVYELLEERSARLEAAMDAAAADYVELERLGAEKSAVDEELAAKVDRWVYLNELNERIQRGEYED